MWGKIVALLGGILAMRALNRRRSVYISVERANAEWKRQQDVLRATDFIYIEKVKDRIMKGHSCTQPPLCNHGAFSRPRLVISNEEAS